jgi:hypothetical protein
MEDNLENSKKTRAGQNIERVLDTADLAPVVLKPLLSIMEYASVYKSCGVKSRDELGKLPERFPDDLQLQDAYQRLLNIEGNIVHHTHCWFFCVTMDDNRDWTIWQKFLPNWIHSLVKVVG